jgi:glycosyltransferase involved in cell wall biosynthesis
MPPVLACRPRDLPADIDQGFVLSLGSICQRKNQRLLLQVWRRLIERHGSKVPPLVLVGRVERTCASILQEIRSDRAVEGRLFVLEHSPDTETRWLLERCRFTMFPSHYEGWGLPVAESLTLGKYCISSNTSSLPEIAGDLIDYHAPHDAARCQQLVEQALFTPGFLAQREQRIRGQYRTTTWQRCAEAVFRFIVEQGACRAAVENSHAA